MKLISDERRFKQEVGKPNFKSITFYDKKFVGVQMRPATVMLDNPVAAGFTVLELSKLHMHRFHYGFALPRLGGVEKCQLQMTDSLVYLVEDAQPKAIFSANECYIDFSNFPTSHPMFSRTNQKVKGTFKVEHPDNAIIGFVGIRAKMYCFQFLSSECQAKAKGIPRSALKNICFEDYCQALFSPKRDQPLQDDPLPETPSQHR
jgi:hypothetical protein